MDISVIIPTYNREQDLKNLLETISQQTRLPTEIIVVDDSEKPLNGDLIKQLTRAFLEKGIVFTYFQNELRKGLAASRNYGVLQAKGEIIIFLDDDIILDRNYIEEIVRVFEEEPNALGVQGHLKLNIPYSKLANTLNKILFTNFFEKDKCRVLPSGANTYPFELSRKINCQWLSGTNQSYRRIVFKDFKFDEKLKFYSFTEDMDFSCRLYKSYPNSLFMTPGAKVIHKESKISRANGKSQIYMMTVYGSYFFYKNVKQTFVNLFIFVWSKIARLIFDIGLVFLKRKTRVEIQRIRLLLESYAYTLRHLEHIRKGNLDFFDRYLSLNLRRNNS